MPAKEGRDFDPKSVVCKEGVQRSAFNTKRFPVAVDIRSRSG
jgi:hypothetical protein